MKYWDVYTNMMSVPKAKRAETYGKVAVNPQLGMLLDTAKFGDEHNVINYGTVRHRYDWNHSVRDESTLVFGDCMDQSQFGTLDATTKDPIVRGKALTPMQITMTPQAGVWKVVGIYYKKSGPPC